MAEYDVFSDVLEKISKLCGVDDESTKYSINEELERIYRLGYDDGRNGK